MASSSWASASTCSADRCAVGSGLPERFGTCRRSCVWVDSRELSRGAPTELLVSVMGCPLQVDVAGTGRGRHARLDADAVLGDGRGHVAAAQVPDGALAQPDHAAEAD